MNWTHRVTLVLLLATMLWGMAVHFQAPDLLPPTTPHPAPLPDSSTSWRLNYGSQAEAQSFTAQNSHERSIAELLELAKTDPAAAAGLALELTDLTARAEATVQIALAWGKSNPAAAFAWVQSITNDIELKQNTLCSLCSQSAETDPAGAVATALSLDLGSQKSSLMENLVMKWAALDSSAALNWALQTPDALERDHLVGRVVVSLADQTPEAAADLVVTKMAAGEAQDQAAISVIYKWTQRDPNATAAWVSGFPEGPLQNEAVQNLIGSWAMTDDAGATRWLATLPAGPARDAGELMLTQTRQRVAPVAYTGQ